MKSKLSLFFLILVILIQSCSQEEETERIIIKGSELLSIPVESISSNDLYTNLLRNVDIRVIGGGSARGVGAIIDKSDCDIAMLDRELSNMELTALERNNIEYTTLDFIISRIRIIVHPKNQMETITLDQLKNIFTGTTMLWSEAAPESNLARIDDEILIVTSEANTGNYFTFQDRILNNRNYSDQIIQLASDDEIIEYVSLHQSSIGFVSEYYVMKKIATEAEIAQYISANETANGFVYDFITQEGYRHEGIKVLPVEEYLPFEEDKESTFFHNKLMTSTYLLIKTPTSEAISKLINTLYSEEAYLLIKKMGFKYTPKAEKSLFDEIILSTIQSE